MKFTPIVHPFTPTARLQEHVRQYLFEYAAFGRESWQWPEDFIGWRITDNFDEEAGFVRAWLCKHGFRPIRRGRPRRLDTIRRRPPMVPTAGGAWADK